MNEFECQRRLPSFDWATRGMCPGRTVARFVPQDFECYVRILHPAYFTRARDRVLVSWADLAAARGVEVTPTMRFEDVCGTNNYENGPPEPDGWTDPPLTGSLPTPVSGSLADALAHHTRTPECCWFAFWPGFGLKPTASVRGRLVVPGREYLVVGPMSITHAIENLTPGWSWEQSYSAWWPDDLSWFVATDIDQNSTFVGASRMCAKDLIAQPSLECLTVDRHDEV